MWNFYRLVALSPLFKQGRRFTFLLFGGKMTISLAWAQRQNVNLLKTAAYRLSSYMARCPILRVAAKLRNVLDPAMLNAM